MGLLILQSIALWFAVSVPGPSLMSAKRTGQAGALTYPLSEAEPGSVKRIRKRKILPIQAMPGSSSTLQDSCGKSGHGSPCSSLLGHFRGSDFPVS